MATSGRETVQHLWDLGARIGRPPEDTPEADPWDEPDPFEAPTMIAVVFPGRPAVTVRLFSDGKDTVVVEDQVDLEVPRLDTVAVVDAVLSGRARLRPRGASTVTRILGGFLGSITPTELVVRLPEVGRQYSAPVSSIPGTYGLTGFPWEDARTR
jgi:hypothetical protein